MTGESQNATYEFKTLGVDDFELLITFQPIGNVLAILINKAHQAIRMKTGVMPREHELEGILDKHELPSVYNRLVHTFVKPILKDVHKTVLKDGILIVREEPQKVLFYKKDSQWFIDIKLVGSYSKIVKQVI